MTAQVFNLATVPVSNTPADEMEIYLNTLFDRCTEGFVEFRKIPIKGVATQEWIRLDTTVLPDFPNDQNIYVGVATRKEGEGGKSAIVEIPAVWVDIDFKKDDDEAKAQEIINGFSLQPSIIVKSGHGFHGYWILKTPAKRDDIPKIEEINRKLVFHFAGDNASTEAARILRLPGTYNIKYNPPVLVTIERINQNAVYDLCDFDFLPLPPSSPQPAVMVNPTSQFAKLLDGVFDGSRNTTLVSLASHYREKGLPEDETQRLLALWNCNNKPPLEEKELVDTIKYNYKHYLQNKVTTKLDADSYSLEDCSRIIAASIMRVPAFMRKQLPDRPYIISPVLKQGEIIMISAARGVGKTWFALSLAFMATRKSTIGNWETNTPVPTLYIDGEMSEDELQDRIFNFKLGRQAEQAPLYLLSSDEMRNNEKKPPNLINPVWRNGISEYLKSHEDIKLVIFDNLASLTPGRDENKKRDWDEINQWFLCLRSKGVAVLFLHHEGKGGEQRGTSAIEDNINFSIKLKHPEGYRREDGAKFKVEFSKTRRLYGDDAKSFTLCLRSNNSVLDWEVIADEDNQNANQIIDLWRNGEKQKDIAKKLDVTASWVSQVVKKAKEEEKARRMAIVDDVTKDSPDTKEAEVAEHQDEESPDAEEVELANHED